MCDIDVRNRRIKISATLISISIEMKSKTQIPILIFHLSFISFDRKAWPLAMKNKIPGGLFENEKKNKEKRVEMVHAFDAFVYQSCCNELTGKCKLDCRAHSTRSA